MLHASAGLLLQCKVAICGVDQIVHHLPDKQRVARITSVGVAQSIQLPLQSSCRWLNHDERTRNTQVQKSTLHVSLP